VRSACFIFGEAMISAFPEQKGHPTKDLRECSGDDLDSVEVKSAEGWEF